MEQQLITSVIDILPTTMDQVLSQIQPLLASQPLDQDQLLPNIIKSLFYGLWNFDKMINQHNLSTKIAQLLLKIPKKNAFLFFKAFLVYLHQKWNLIDHHRINKFMQLVRYLLVHAFKLCDKHKLGKKKIDQILLNTVFSPTTTQNGLIYHLLDIYFQVCNQNLAQGTGLDELTLFEEILTTHPNQHLRLYLIEHVYEPYKVKLVQNMTTPEDLEEKITKFCERFLELAQKEEKEHHRKNMYSIVGYAKSEELSFDKYYKEKQEKAMAEKEKKHKIITKSKRAQIRQLKKKRKDKKEKQGKKGKIMSVFKFQDRNRQKKGIQEL